LQQTQEAVKQAGDAASILVVAGTLLDALPAVAAAFTIVWTAIRIWETQTVKGMVACLLGRFKRWRK